MHTENLETIVLASYEAVCSLVNQKLKDVGFIHQAIGITVISQDKVDMTGFELPKNAEAIVRNIDSIKNEFDMSAHVFLCLVSNTHLNIDDVNEAELAGIKIGITMFYNNRNYFGVGDFDTLKKIASFSGLVETNQIDLSIALNTNNETLH